MVQSIKKTTLDSLNHTTIKDQILHSIDSTEQKKQYEHILLKIVNEFSNFNRFLEDCTNIIHSSDPKSKTEVINTLKNLLYKIIQYPYLGEVFENVARNPFLSKENRTIGTYIEIQLRLCHSLVPLKEMNYEQLYLYAKYILLIKKLFNIVTKEIESLEEKNIKTNQIAIYLICFRKLGLFGIHENIKSLKTTLPNGVTEEHLEKTYEKLSKYDSRQEATVLRLLFVNELFEKESGLIKDLKEETLDLLNKSKKEGNKTKRKFEYFKEAFRNKVSEVPNLVIRPKYYKQNFETDLV